MRLARRARGAPARASLAPGEARRALLRERDRALEEVLAARHLALQLGLELELLVHARVQPVVELALATRVGASRPCRQALSQLSRLAGELLVLDDAVDEPPLERLRRGHPLTEHRELRGTCHAHARWQEQRGAAVGHEPDVDEGEQEV